MKNQLFPLILAVLCAKAAAQSAQGPGPVTIQRVGTNQYNLIWYGENLRPYQIEGSPDLFTWAEIGPMQVGTDALLGYTHTNTAAKHFYRVREGAMRPGFDDVEYGRNDDMTYPSTDANPTDPQKVPIGFTVHFFGNTYTDCYVNNNGNITFDKALDEYTPFGLGDLRRIMIAPFWADVDTRNLVSGITRFTEFPEIADGHPAFGVTWRNVGYFERRVDKFNSFQMLLIDRSGDFGAGDFDIEFNYNQIQWETGEAATSGGVDGLGGHPARVGWANGSGRFMEYKGSAQTLAFLDQKPGQSTPNFADGLKYQMWNSTVPGRIVIPVRGGIPGGATGYDFQVSAGSDQYLQTYSSSTFTLTGSITPPDTSGVTYQWTQVGNPDQPQAVISNADLLSTTVTIPEPGEYTFRLTGTKQGTFFSSSSDEVLVTHGDVIHVDGGFYEVSASSLTTFPLWSAVATYNGYNIADVEWEQIEGDPVSISDTHILKPWITPPGPGEYKFRLTARTGGAAQWVQTSEATVIIT